ncbi:MAG: AAA family ATPase, partial [Acetobacteraceae bacterium]
VRFKDFRRFRGTCTLDLDETLVALVGPNEAGKSSILDGIEMLLARRGPQPRDVSRGFNGQAEIGGLFFLEEEDRTAIASIYDAERVARVWVTLGSSQETEIWDLDERPIRDLGPRRRCETLLRALEGDPILDAQYSTRQDLLWEPQLFVDVLEQLALDTETLPEESIAKLEALAPRLRTLSYPEPQHPEGEPGGNDAEADEGDDDAESDEAEEHRRLAREAADAALVELARTERLATPWRQMVDILRGRLPTAAFFRSEDRELRTDYGLAEVVGSMPNALANLSAIAGLSITVLPDTVVDRVSVVGCDRVWG